MSSISDNDTPREQGSADAETKLCPRCAETVKAAAVVCRFCGYDFTAASAPAAESPTASLPASRLAGLSRRQRVGLSGVAVALVAAVILVIVLTSSGNTYPTNVQTNFLNACEANGGSTSRCGCALSNIESSVSLSQFKTAESAIEAGDSNYPQWMLKAVTSCA